MCGCASFLLFFSLSAQLNGVLSIDYAPARNPSVLYSPLFKVFFAPPLQQNRFFFFLPAFSRLFGIKICSDNPFAVGLSLPVSPHTNAFLLFIVVVGGFVVVIVLSLPSCFSHVPLSSLRVCAGTFFSLLFAAGLLS